MLLIACGFGLILPVLLSARGHAYRGIYFAGVLVAGVVGYGAIELTGPALTGSTYQQQVGQQFINDYGPSFATMMFSIAFGCAIAACVYRQNALPAPTSSVKEEC